MLTSLGQSGTSAAAAAADLDAHLAGPPTAGALSVAKLDILDTLTAATPARDGTGLNVLAQLPSTTGSSATFASDGDTQYGIVEVWMMKVVKSADVAYDAGVLNFFGGTKKARTHKYRIVKISTVLHALRTGGVPNHEIRIEKGDGAGSEVFTTIAGDFDVDGNTLGGITNRNQTNTDGAELVLTGQTLRVNPLVAGATTTGTFEIDVYIHVIPVRA